MNSLYTLALRQSTSLQNDLNALESAYQSGSQAETASLNGQINASLAALDRTTEDYENLARREIVEVKREKAMSRVSRFKEDFISLRKQYEKIKATGSSARAASDRNSLLSSTSALSTGTGSASSRLQGRHPSYSVPQAGDESPFAINMAQSASNNGSQQGTKYTLNNPEGVDNWASSGGGGGGGMDKRTKYALGEHDFLQSTGSTLDGYIAMGQATMMNLGNQRDMLKGTQRRLLSAANTLGLSRNTIQYIERRTKEDYYILMGGGAFTLFCFYLILKYFG